MVTLSCTLPGRFQSSSVCHDPERAALLTQAQVAAGIGIRVCLVNAGVEVDCVLTATA